MEGNKMVKLTIQTWREHLNKKLLICRGIDRIVFEAILIDVVELCGCLKFKVTSAPLELKMDITIPWFTTRQNGARQDKVFGSIQILNNEEIWGYANDYYLLHVFDPTPESK